MVRRGSFATMTLAELFAAVALPLLGIIAACGGKLDRDASQRGTEEPGDGGGDARSSSGGSGTSGIGGGGDGGVGFAGEAGGGVAEAGKGGAGGSASGEAGGGVAGAGKGGAGGGASGEGGTAEAGSGLCPAYEVSRVVFENLVSDPVVVWSGEEYAVFWSETQSGASYPFSEDHWYHIEFLSLDRNGRPIARETPFSTYELDEHNVAIDVGTATVVAAAPGAEGRLGVVWCFHPSDDDDTLMFAEVTTSGVAVGEPVSIGRCDWGTFAGLAWNESGYGLAWSCGADICFVEVDESGVAVGETLQIPSTSLMAALFLFYDGEQYALAWNEFDSVGGVNRLLRIPPGASSLGQSVPLTDPDTHYADTLFVSPVDTGYLALWYQRAIADGTEDGLVMVRLDPAGKRLEDPHWFEEPAVAALRSNGSEYGAVLLYRLEREDLSGLEYRFASLSPQGHWLTNQVTLGAAESPTSLVLHEWHETGFGVFFTARGVDGTSLVYAQLRCDR